MGYQDQKRGAALARRHILLAAGALAALPAAARAEWLRDEVVVYADPALRPVLAAIGPQFPQAQRVRCFCAPPRQMVMLLAHGTQDDVLITQPTAIAAARAAGLLTGPDLALWRNRLVFATAADTPPTPAFTLDALVLALGTGQLALPDPSDASPIDGPALLQRLGIAEKLAGRTIGAADTEDAIATLRRGEATVALCHVTDGVETGRYIPIPDAAYDPILYTAALSQTAWSRYNDAFLHFLAAQSAPTARRLGLEILS